MKLGVLFGLCAVGIFGVYLREFSLFQRSPTIYVSQEGAAIVNTQSPILFLGKDNWFRDIIKSKNQSWIFPSTELTLDHFQIGALTREEARRVFRLAENFSLIEINQSRLLVIDGEVEVGPLFEQALIFESDYWFVFDSFFPEGLPVPNKGIIYLTGRAPTKSWKEIALSHQVPLVIVGKEDIQILEL